MKYIHMLPFLDDEDLDELVEKIKNGEVKNIKMTVLYPFLSTKSLESLVDFYIKENNTKQLSRTLPFISTEKVNEIYDGIENGTITGMNEISIMPFLGRSKIKEMFHKSIKEAANSKESFDEEEDE